MKRCKTCSKILGTPPICFYCKDKEEGKSVRPKSIRYQTDSMHQLLARG